MYRARYLLLFVTTLTYTIEQKIINAIYNSNLVSTTFEMRGESIDDKDKIEYLNFAARILNLRQKELLSSNRRTLKIQSAKGQLFELAYDVSRVYAVVNLIMWATNRSSDSEKDLLTSLTATFISHKLMNYVEDIYIEQRYKDALKIKHLFAENQVTKS